MYFIPQKQFCVRPSVRPSVLRRRIGNLFFHVVRCCSGAPRLAWQSPSALTEVVMPSIAKMSHVFTKAHQDRLGNRRTRSRNVSLPASVCVYHIAISCINRCCSRGRVQTQAGRYMNYLPQRQIVREPTWGRADWRQTRSHACARNSRTTQPASTIQHGLVTQIAASTWNDHASFSVGGGELEWGTTARSLDHSSVVYTRTGVWLSYFQVTQETTTHAFRGLDIVISAIHYHAVLGSRRRCRQHHPRVAKPPNLRRKRGREHLRQHTFRDKPSRVQWRIERERIKERERERER